MKLGQGDRITNLKQKHLKLETLNLYTVFIFLLFILTVSFLIPKNLYSTQNSRREQSRLFPTNQMIDISDIIKKAKFDHIAIQDRGIIRTLKTFSKMKLGDIFDKKILEKTVSQSAPGFVYDPMVIYLMMIFDTEFFYDKGLFSLKNELLRKKFSEAGFNATLSYNDLYSEAFKKYVTEIEIDNRQEVLALNKLLREKQDFEKIKENFLIVPDITNAENKWLSINEVLDNEKKEYSEVRASLIRIEKILRSKDFKDLENTLISFVNSVKKLRFYPSESYLWIDYVNSTLQPVVWVFVLYLIGALFFFISANTQNSLAHLSGLISLVIGLIIHTVVIIMRYIAVGGMPLSNMYEATVFCIWGLILFVIIFELIYKKDIVGLIGSILSFITYVLINSMPGVSGEIEPVPQILDSPWKTYHVMSIMLSYSAFLLSFGFGVLYLLKNRIGEKKLSWIPELKTLDMYNYLAIKIGIPLLTVGIVTGALWANVAWGRLWRWDPKETSALITWFIYLIYLHLRFNKGWVGKKTAIVSIIGFLAVLFTFLGVNFIISGLHSYAVGQ